MAVTRGEPALQLSLAPDGESLNWRRETLEFLFDLGVEIEEFTQQVPRGLAHDDLAWGCRGLQSSR